MRRSIWNVIGKKTGRNFNRKQTNLRTGQKISGKGRKREYEKRKMEQTAFWRFSNMAHNSVVGDLRTDDRLQRSERGWGRAAGSGAGMAGGRKQRSPGRGRRRWRCSVGCAKQRQRRHGIWHAERQKQHIRRRNARGRLLGHRNPRLSGKGLDRIKQ